MKTQSATILYYPKKDKILIMYKTTYETIDGKSNRYEIEGEVLVNGQVHRVPVISYDLDVILRTYEFVGFL